MADETSAAVVRVVDLLDDLRADSATLRETAARQVESLGTFSPEVTGALRRAVAKRDMAAREGLVRAIERAAATGRPAIDELRATASAAVESTSRTMARAGLHEVDGGGK
jgi:hypothetical protein